MKKILNLGLFLILCSIGSFAQTPTPAPSPGTYEFEKTRADRLQARFNDFANFARYKDANAKLTPPVKDEKHVVFMGDSITDGWKLTEYFPNQPYINRGISGQTTPQMLIRFRPDVINLKPKVVVILAGTNDISFNTGPTTIETIEGNLTSMVELAHANGINVVIASVLPISDYNKNKAGEAIIRSVIRPPAQILELNNWIKKYCAEKDLVYLDYFSATVDDKGFFKAELANDGLHPNEKGYAVMKPLVEQAITVALKKKQKK
jgi:lysophospholipase L1-like esterase